MKRVLLFAGLSVSCLSTVAFAQVATDSSSQSEQEVLRLRRDIKERDGQIAGLSEMLSGISDDALKAPFGRFLIIKQGSQGLALQITEHPMPATGHSKYRWFLQTDGTFDFAKSNVRHGQGELGRKVNGKANVFIKAGIFNLRWSESDWINFPQGSTSLQMIPSEWVRPEDIKLKTYRGPWLTKSMLAKWRKPTNQPAIVTGRIKYHPKEMAALSVWMQEHGYYPSKTGQYGERGNLPSDWDYQWFEVIRPSLTTVYGRLIITKSGDLMTGFGSYNSALPSEVDDIKKKSDMLTAEIEAYYKALEAQH